MAKTMPPFPVDDVMLDAVEHALSGALTVDADGTQHLVGADYSLPQLLNFLSGYDPEQVVPLVDEDGYEVPGWTEYVGGVMYTRDCIIRALIAEIRRLRSANG